MAKSGMSESDVESGGTEAEKLMAMGENNGSEINPNNIVARRSQVTTSISILIESLVKNLCAVYETDPEKVVLLYEIICDRLYNMNMIDESYKMTEFDDMRVRYQKAFLHLLRKSLGVDKSVPLRPILPTTDYEDSRYYRDFKEIEYIAGGGFGQVFRVRHKLDGNEYAVKKIPIREDGIKSVLEYLAEAKMFGSMNHSNIVQYKGAWLEMGPPASNGAITESDTESYTEKTEHLDDEYIYHRDERHSFSDGKDEDSSDFEISFEYGNNSFNKESVKALSRVERSSISEGGNTVCKVNLKEIEELKTQQRSRVKWATLYIQMTLCQSTLKQWLERRNDAEGMREGRDNSMALMHGNVRNDTIFEVLRQLLKGLEYMHFKGIVHHDVKPSNVFVLLENGNLLVQLGDFGLACPLQSVQHTLAFGTKLYAAPEQLAGKCDPKSDMYSLGIVLFELVESFGTDMERVKYINELRRGALPEHVLIQQPQFAEIILKLVDRCPESRPDASTLLKSITQDYHDYIQELECKLAERDNEISRLKELLKSAGVKSM